MTQRGKGRSPVIPGWNWTGDLRPYPVAPMKTVPDHIEKPDYYTSGVPMDEIESRWQNSVASRTPEEIEKMRKVNLIGRQILDKVRWA